MYVCVAFSTFRFEICIKNVGEQVHMFILHTLTNEGRMRGEEEEFN